MSVPKAKRKTDPCPCGSGKQYRYCHGAKPNEDDEGPVIKGNRPQVFLWVVLIGAPLAYGLGMLAQPAGSGAGTKRVWSEEHGHYHNVDGSEPAAAATNTVSADGAPAADGTPAPRPTKPPGPTPPGKVWSEAHGHWHDADGGTPEAQQVLVDPVSGKPWDHDYKLEKPDGPAPEGMTWSASHGHWHPNQ